MSTKVIKIGKKIIDFKSKCFIVAEISANHGGKIENAYALIRAAKKSGADAVKLQTYTADTITLNSKKKDFLIKNHSPWSYRKNLWSLYNKAKTPLEWHEKLFKFAKKLNLVIFSSPFDENAVDFLEGFGCPAYKLASQEINHIPLIKKIASTKKPIIISTGLCSKEEVSKAVRIIRGLNNNKIIILKCTSSYPATSKELNLLTIKDIKKSYNVIPGFSDHTLGYTSSIVAVMLGAKLIEKHISLPKKNSVDSFFSTNVNDFELMVHEIREAENSVGKIDYKPSKNSKKQHYAGRRSIYVVKNIGKGEKFTKHNIKVIRPHYGLMPKFYDQILNKISKKKLVPGTRMKLKYIKKNNEK